jgi:hypothetical protein
MSLFGRYTEVTIGPSPEVTDLADALKNQTVDPATLVGRIYDTGKYVSGIWVPGIKIEFTINGESSSKTDECAFEIWNMAPFGTLFGKNSPVVLKSGYLQNYNTIFTGVVQDIFKRVDGCDTVTKFICKQEQKQILSVYTNHVFAIGTRWSEVVKKLIADTAVVIGFVADSDVRVMDNDWYASSDQSVYRWVDWVVKNKLFSYDAKGNKVKWKWYLRNGLFYCMPENMAFPTGVLISAKTGLLSVQKADTQSDKKKKDMWVIKMLLIPVVNKDTIFLVVSASGTKTFYKTQTYKFTSSGGNHITEANVKEISVSPDAYEALIKGLPHEFDEEFGEDEQP